MVSGEYDGPTLRSVRESVKVPLRRVSRLGGFSHGHLSKVERGEHGRPVTPAVLAAYEKATGVRLSDAKVVGFGDGSADTSGAGWRRGKLSHARRLGFNSQVAGVAVGGPVGDTAGRLIDAIGRQVIPEQVGPADVLQVEQAAQLATALDLQCGGGLVSQLARTMLRWAVGLTTAAATAEVHQRLQAAVAHLSQRAAWAAFDADAHDAARSLFTVALDSAVQARDRDLRAHILADVAAQHNHLGYPDDALEMLSLAEGDRRVSPPVRLVLAAVAARVHAAAGDLPACRASIDTIERQHVLVGEHAEPVAGWQATFSTRAYLYAATGHATAVLARRSGAEADRHRAQQLLSAAVQGFDPSTHTRARALCTARLAVLSLEAGDHEQGTHWGRQALAAAREGVRSARLTRHLAAVRATAIAQSNGNGNGNGNDPTLRELVTEYDTEVEGGWT